MLPVLNDTFWFAMGVAATLLTAFVAHRIGRLQISFMQKAHDLKVLKAIPKIGASLRIVTEHPNGTSFPYHYSLVATIYNEGNLAAKDLKGNCKLFSPTKQVAESTIPINRDFLGMNHQYELAACPVEGATVNNGMIGAAEIRFNMDIEFEYFGLPEDKPQQYAAKYEYDNKSRQMKRIYK